MEIFLTIGEHELAPTLVTSLIVFTVLILFFIVCGMTIKRADPRLPSQGLMAIIEIIYNSISKFVRSNVNPEATKFIPYVVTMASYLVVANLVGLLGLAAPVTNISITLGLTLVALTYIMISGIRSKGLGSYLKDTYVGNVPKSMLILFIPVNIVSEASKIISLTFRLFGNMVSGMLLVALMMQLVVFVLDLLPSIGWILGVFIPFLNAYFDVFAGLMQTFIFCTLTMVWMKAAVERQA